MNDSANLRFRILYAILYDPESVKNHMSIELVILSTMNKITIKFLNTNFLGLLASVVCITSFH